MDFIGKNHVLNAIWPVGDSYESGPIASAAVNMSKFDHATFILQEAAGGAGTTTITMVACTDTSQTSPTGIGFRYRVMNTQDVWSAVSAVVTTYATVAGANKMIAIEVDAAALTAAKPYLGAVLTELVDASCLAGAIWILTEAAYPQSIPVTAIA